MEVPAWIAEFDKYFSPSLYIFAIGAILFESILMGLRKAKRDRLGRIVSIFCGIGSFGMAYLFYIAVAYYAQMWVYQFRIFDLGFNWWVWVLAFMINDLMFYLLHYADHKVRLFWCCHVVHHSAKHYDLTTGIRGSFFESAFHFWFYVWIPILGIHPVIIILMDTFFKFFGLSYHVSLIDRLGLLEKIIVTPSTHRVHHGKNIKYLDRNYGGFFIIWDKLFGTFQQEEETPTYGILKGPDSYNLWTLQTHEFQSLWKDIRSARKWSDKLRYIIKPPGWSHNGQHATAKELQLKPELQ